MSAGNSIPPELIQEGERIMRLCNACRYCEGFCAVFPAMERRLTFSEQDINYLANLCHNCSECYYACPYAPPHEFSLNLPQRLAEIRVETYRKYAWPGFFGGLFRRNRLAVILSMVASPALFVLALLSFIQPPVLFSAHSVSAGSFYAVLSHNVMTVTFGVVSLWILAALVLGLAAFWHESGQAMGDFLGPGAFGQAVWDTLRLRYLEGGPVGNEAGCAYPGEVPSHARRWFHHLTFYGFLFCFAATTVAAIYHYVFRWEAPYRLLSAPVILGTVGGLGLLAGPIGLLWLKGKRNPELTDPKRTAMDVGFLALLFLTSLTGLLLLALRETAAMGVLLGLHLGFVMGVFITMPYGKFVHGVYRFAALVRNAIEKQRSFFQPSPK
jgi:citrate/tricarballylate utilization protein